MMTDREHNQWIKNGVSKIQQGNRIMLWAGIQAMIYLHLGLKYEEYFLIIVGSIMAAFVPLMFLYMFFTQNCKGYD